MADHNLSAAGATEIPDRLWRKVREMDGGCWEWTGGINWKGYGKTWFDGATRQAHRVMYELLVGPISDGMQLDHLCRNRSCVNPDHLEPVTSRVNTLRGNTFQAANAAKTRCPKGHPYDGENLYVKPNGERCCRACRKGQYKARARGIHHNTAKTHCPAGHEYAGENLYRAPNGDRLCRACRRANSKQRRKR